MVRRIVYAIAALFALCSLRATGPVGARTVVFHGGNYGQPEIALPGKPLSFAIGVRESDAFSLDIFPIDRRLYAAIRSNSDDVDTGFAARAVRHVAARVDPTDTRYYRLTHVTVPGLPIGLYAVRVNASNYAAVQLLDVATFGVIAEHGAKGDSLFAVDLTSFHKRTDVTVRSVDGAAVAPVHVDNDGLAFVTGIKSSTLSATSDDGSVAFSQTFPYSIGLQRTGLLQVDRPLYRPGTTVSYRLIVRDAKDDAFVLPSGNADVTILDPAGKVVATEAPLYDSFGTISGSYALPEDAQLGTYRVLDHDTFVGNFSVQAYVKPEYAVDIAAPDTGVIAGDVARFSVRSHCFFGKAAAGLKLHYKAQLDVRQWRGVPRYLRLPIGPVDAVADVPLAEGEATADGQGLATIVIPTTKLDGDLDRDMVLDVDGRDASGKTVTARSVVAVSRASFHIGVSLDRYFARAGDDVSITLTTRTQSGTVSSNVPVTLSFSPDEGNASPVPDTIVATTDATGIAHLTWHADRDGYVRIVARARDSRGRETTTASYVWIASHAYGYRYRFGSTTVSPQKTSYAPGETAQVLVTGPRGDVDALVNVTGGSTDSTFVRHLETVASTIDIDIPSDAAKVAVSVWVPTPEGIGFGETTINVAPAPHRLDVSIVPGKRSYAPGDLARFALDVRDEGGRPAQAEIGVGVVDDAVSALTAPPAADEAFNRFYGPARYRGAVADWRLDGPFTLYAANHSLRTIASVRTATGAFQPQQTADQFTVAASAIEPPPTFDDLRSDFRDTAYWAPSVHTDTAGHAVVTFRWPDNLTSYTASGIAVAQDTAIGSGDGHALVTKDYLVRLATPRFMRRSDRARFIASANGPKGATRTRLRFSAPQFGIADRTVTARFDRYASASSDFDVASGPLGTSLVRLAGTSGTFSDGLQRSLTVESDGVATHARFAGSLPHDPALTFVLPAGAEAGAMRIDLSPSIVAELYANVKLLDVYPYYCVEQTMSAALPLIDVERLAKRSGLPVPAGNDPDTIAAHAVARLEQLQHGDGSWGWWESDPANPFMTAYAVYGLAELRRDGHAVPDDVMQRGIASLKGQLPGGDDTLGLWAGPQPGSLYNTRAFMFFALADASPNDVDRKALADVDAHAAQLNPYALSALGLVHVTLSDRAGAEPLFERLKTLVKDDGTYTHWSGGGWHYHWEDDPIETTAYALRFYHAMEPDSPRIRTTIAWLLSQSRGSWWYTTKDTAAAIYALTDALDPDPSEFHPNETIDVYLGFRRVRSVQVRSAILDSGTASIDVPATDVAGGGTIRFVRRGRGSLYWSADWTRYVRDGARSESDIDARDAGELSADTADRFTVERTYRAARTPWKIGDVINVTLTVRAANDAQFVAIEDPLPAGLEYQPRLHEANDSWSGVQFFDDRVVFFDSMLYARWPITLTYNLRASTAGSFTAPPATAYSMYGPPVRAIGHARHVTIVSQ